MAIDSEDKRRSALGHPWSINLPVADGTISGTDRQHSVWQYRGIAAATLGLGVFGDVVVGPAILGDTVTTPAVLGDVTVN